MKLSEAMRIGAAKRPQCRGVYFGYPNREILTPDLEPPPVKNCAIGAALEGAGKITDLYDVTAVEYPLDEKLAEFGVPFDASMLCPVHECEANIYNRDSTLSNTIFHLNDDHFWTREAIADWLASLGY